MASYYGQDPDEAMQWVIDKGIYLGTPSIIHVLTLTESEMHLQDDWDVPPEFLFFTMERIAHEADPDDPEMALVAGATHVGTIPMPRGGGTDIERVLDETGPVLIRFIQDKVPGPIIGFALLNEGWGVSVEQGDIDKEFEVMQQVGQLEKRADAVEMRVFTAVDRYRNVISVTRGRGDATIEIAIHENGEGQAQDRLTSALHRLVDLIP